MSALELQRTRALLKPLLVHFDLWRWLDHEADSSRGCLHFTVTDVDQFQAQLTHDSRFGGVKCRPDGSWQCRAIGLRAALHLKHFVGWSPTKVQAHIDPWGARPGGWWWLCPPVPLGVLAAHALDPRGYLDLDRLERLLVQNSSEPD